MGAIQGSVNQALGSVGAAAMAMQGIEEHRQLVASQTAASEIGLRNAEEDLAAATAAQERNEANIADAKHRAENIIEMLGRMPKGKKSRAAKETFGKGWSRAIEETQMYERAREELAANVANRTRALEYARVEYGRFHKGAK